MYLDCDMVTNRDISELYDIDISDCIIGAVRDVDVAGQVNLNKNNWEDYAINSLKLDSPYDYFQAGVLIINLDRLRETVNTEIMIELAISNKWRCLDQDVLNIVCKNQICYIPQQWNTLMSWKEQERSRMQIIKMAPRELYGEYMEARKNPYIIHFAGYQKPWDVVDCDFADYFWKYAKLSPYYPQFLMNIKSNEKRKKANLYDNVTVRKVANYWLPIGSRRREILKKIVNR